MSIIYMPGGTVYNILNITSKFAINRPQYILIGIILAIIFIIYCRRLFQIKQKYFPIGMVSLALVLISVVILSTFLHVLHVKDSYGYIESFSFVFNSSGGVNFFAIILLLFFIIYIYEFPKYDNNNPNGLLDKIMLGHNNYISNRTSGIMMIFVFGIFTAYTVMLTTNERIDN